MYIPQKTNSASCVSLKCCLWQFNHDCLEFVPRRTWLFHDLRQSLKCLWHVVLKDNHYVVSFTRAQRFSSSSALFIWICTVLETSVVSPIRVFLLLPLDARTVLSSFYDYCPFGSLFLNCRIGTVVDRWHPMFGFASKIWSIIESSIPWSIDPSSIIAYILSSIHYIYIYKSRYGSLHVI